MAATDVEFEQNAGTPTQLPQGEVSELNAQLPSTEPTALAAEPITAAPEEAPLPEPEAALPQDYDPVYQPETEEDDFLVGPTLRPEEDVSAGARPRHGLDNGVKSALPFLQAAAAEGDSSEELKALVGLLLREA